MLITITGASGSGKSSISEYLCSLTNNIVHLNIDTIGHKVLEIPEITKMISKEFHINIENGKIDRKKLGDLVFNNHEDMKKLSDITWKAMESLIDEFISENKDKIIILDWILIPKTKYYSTSDINILINAHFKSRMNRATLRDGIDESAFILRDKATLDYSKNNFDYIIFNDDFNKARKAVKEIYDESIISR